MAATHPAARRIPLLGHLLDQTRLSAGEVAARVRNARDPGYWESLCPGLSVRARGRAAGRRARPLSARRQQELAGSLARFGYFNAPGLIPRQTAARMARCVETVKRAGWPPVFAFVYDLFWTIWQPPPVDGLLSAALGAGYLMRPHLWVYYVHPVRGARGWPPHADELGARGVSVWIPLTDATLDNGCIYVVPKDLVRGIDIVPLTRAKRMPVDAVAQLVQSARALPAPAGSVLGWDFDLLHWGATCHGGTEPRVSLSAEFVPAGRSSGRRGLPVIDVRRAIPGFADRLALIAENIGMFARNDAWTFKYLDLGKRLLELAPRGRRAR